MFLILDNVPFYSLNNPQGQVLSSPWFYKEENGGWKGFNHLPTPSGDEPGLELGGPILFLVLFLFSLSLFFYFIFPGA